MRWGPLAIIGIFVFIAFAATQIPVELDEHRKPSIQTGGNCFIKAGRFGRERGKS